MTKKKKKKNNNKILVLAIVILSIIVFGLALTKIEILNNNTLFKMLKASITQTSYTADEKRSAILETAKAYKRRGTSLQYDTNLKTYLEDPEDISMYDRYYTDGGAFVYSVYKKTFDINIPPTSKSLIDYAFNNASYDEENNFTSSDYVIKLYNNNDDESQEYSSKDTVISELTNSVKEGDIIVVRVKKDDSYYDHAMIVYSVNDLKVIHAWGKNIANTSATQSNYEEEVNFYDENYSSYEMNNETNDAIVIDNLNDLLASDFTPSDVSVITVIRPIGSDGNKFLKEIQYEDVNNEENEDTETEKKYITEDVNLTDASKARLAYKDIEIKKYSSTNGDNSTVSQASTITYQIDIKNNSSNAYSNLNLTESISDAGEAISCSDNCTISNDKKTLTWTISSIGSGVTKTITYNVKIKSNSSYVGQTLSVTGNLDGISTGLVEHKILYTLNSTQQSSIDGNYTSISDINNAYSNLNINLDLPSDLTAEKLLTDSNYINSDYYKMIINSSSIKSLNNSSIHFSDDDYGLTNFDIFAQKVVTPYSLVTGDIIFAGDNVYMYPVSEDILYNIYANKYVAILRPSILMPTKIEISKRTTNVGVGKNLTLGINYYDSNSKYLKDITWSSSDNSVLTVDSNGKLTGVSTGTATITATAANGVSDSVEFTVKDSVSSDSSLSNLSLGSIKYGSEFEDGYLITPIDLNFSSNTTTYSLSIPSEDSIYVMLEATPTDSGSSIEIINENSTSVYYPGEDIEAEITLKPGLNTITVKVIAEDETEKEYTLNITKEYVDSSKLSSLRISGADLNQEFSPNIYTYNTTIVAQKDNDGNISSDFDIYVTAIPELWAGAYAEIIKPASYVWGVNTITVIGHGVSSTTETTTYTINVDIKAPEYNDATLQNIQIKDNSDDAEFKDINYYLPESNSWDSNVTDYIVSLEGETLEGYSKNSINILKNNENQAVNVTMDPEENEITDNTRVITWTIVVTAEDGVTQNTYTITGVRSGNIESRLDNLTISYETDDDETEDANINFSSEQYEYSFSVPNNIEEININALPKYKNAEVSIDKGEFVNKDENSNITFKIDKDDLDKGVNTITILVMADETEEGEQAASIYTLNINKLGSSYNLLTNLYVDGYNLNPNFDPETTGYTLTVDNNVESINIIAENDSDEYIEIDSDEIGKKSLNVGQNIFEINVKSESGDINTYTITVTRLGDLDLGNLEVRNGIYIILDEGTTGSSLANNLNSSYTVSITTSSGEEISNSTKLQTDYRIIINGMVYIAVVKGDFQANGKVNINDVQKLYEYVMADDKTDLATEAQLKAGDMNNDIKLNINDVQKLYDNIYNGGE